MPFHISPCSPASLFADCRVFQRTVVQWFSKLFPLDGHFYLLLFFHFLQWCDYCPWQLFPSGHVAVFLLDRCLEVESMHILHLDGYCQTALQNACSNLHNLQEKARLPSPSPTLNFISLFKCSHSEMRNDFIVGLICISLIIRLTTVSEFSNGWQIVYVERQVEAVGGNGMT